MSQKAPATLSGWQRHYLARDPLEGPERPHVGLPPTDQGFVSVTLCDRARVSRARQDCALAGVPHGEAHDEVSPEGARAEQ